MGSAVTMEELARIAGVRSATVRKAVRELLELLEAEAAEGRLTLADLDATEEAPAPGHGEDEPLGREVEGLHSKPIRPEQ